MADRDTQIDCFPCLCACAESDADLTTTLAWLAERRDDLKQRLGVHGAIVFRGFGIDTADAFDAFVQALDYPNFRYRESLSNAVRVNKTERVFTANESPPSTRIPLHHEMAQTPIVPSRILFCCVTAPSRGGATPLCRSDRLYELLASRCPQFVDAIAEYGLKYTTVMPGSDDAGSSLGRSWQSTFGVTTRQAAEKRLAELGYSWQWDDGALRTTTPALPGIRRLLDGRRTFFNQLIAAATGWKDSRNDPSKAVTLGNGEPLATAGIQAAVDLADQIKVDLNWQTGDVALVDNYTVMHGRMPFEGDRLILASLVLGERVALHDSHTPS